MKPLTLVSPVLTAILAFSLTAPLSAHPGHGNEFEAKGGIERVQVNPETDQQLGIVVTPIEQTAVGGTGVLVPVTSLVDADGKQLAFVQYKNFYEPVEVITGGTQGELIEVTQGLSVGERLVTQGGLMLYAQSRKTQPTDATANTGTAASPQPATTHAEADAEGIPHSHDAEGNMLAAAQQSTGFPIKWIAAGIGGMVLLLGVLSVVALRMQRKGSYPANSRKKSIFSDRKGGTY